MKHRTLIIIFNEFYPEKPLQYKELVSDSKTEELLEERMLARKPRAKRFDAVYKNGSGDHNQWNAHRATKLFGHHLQK